MNENVISRGGPVFKERGFTSYVVRQVSVFVQFSCQYEEFIGHVFWQKFCNRGNYLVTMAIDPEQGNMLSCHPTSVTIPMSISGNFHSG